MVKFPKIGSAIPEFRELRGLRYKKAAVCKGCGFVSAGEPRLAFYIVSSNLQMVNLFTPTRWMPGAWC